ncbi:helix-turn-helix transcriptional regulator [Larkinella terrae]|uniref:HTH luxR-type domain-containing protein n=1 Tax=Larkinella terrae TaxID=2025311 RepID=A0A7K0ENR0_9BACT|nr:helix-turn-helix transcriptional regulator [Larkinella terrae]MRS63191.1 hypothetical protein [Larkinella terrae]
MLGIWHFGTKKEFLSNAPLPGYDELQAKCSHLETQLQQSQAEQNRLASELELRHRELTTQTLNLLQKNTLMEEVRELINEILQATAGLPQTALMNYNRLIRLIDHSFSLDKEWEDFKLYFEQVHQHFFVRLKENCPDLTAGELRLCALVRLNLSLRESATILGISPDSVKTARYRIRKKLNLPEAENLTDFLLKI